MRRLGLLAERLYSSTAITFFLCLLTMQMVYGDITIVDSGSVLHEENFAHPMRWVLRSTFPWYGNVLSVLS